MAIRPGIGTALVALGAAAVGAYACAWGRALGSGSEELTVLAYLSACVLTTAWVVLVTIGVLRERHPGRDHREIVRSASEVAIGLFVVGWLAAQVFFGLVGLVALLLIPAMVA
jgi:hypothetical protein